MKQIAFRFKMWNNETKKKRNRHTLQLPSLSLCLPFCISPCLFPFFSTICFPQSHFLCFPHVSHSLYLLPVMCLTLCLALSVSSTLFSPGIFPSFCFPMFLPPICHNLYCSLSFCSSPSISPVSKILCSSQVSLHNSRKNSMAPEWASTATWLGSTAPRWASWLQGEPPWLQGEPQWLQGELNGSRVSKWRQGEPP